MRQSIRSVQRYIYDITISFCWKAYQEGGRYELFQYRGTLSVVPEGSKK